VARHGGLRVLGLASISNVALSEPQPGQETSHEEVLAAGQQIVPRLMALIQGILARLEKV
jgi:purine nucleoside phosphorylase